MDIENTVLVLKRNNPAIVQKNWVDEYNDTSKWTRARVEDTIDQTMRWAVRQLNVDINAFRDTWPVNSVVSHDDFVALLSGIELSGKLTANSAVDNLYEIIVRWFGFIKKSDRHTILILHGAMMSMEKIGERIGESRLTTSRRHTRALEKITWHLNHPDL